jgi:hypothetical protein
VPELELKRAMETRFFRPPGGHHEEGLVALFTALILGLATFLVTSQAVQQGRSKRSITAPKWHDRNVN